MTTNHLLDRIRQATLEPPGSRKSVADFLLREGSGVANLSMAEVANLTFTSKPSLVRFAKAMGYLGWRDFRMAFVTAMREDEESTTLARSVDPNHPFGPEDTLREVVGQVALLECQAISEVSEQMDELALMEAATRVLYAQRLVFFGDKPNRFFGELFAYKLDQIDIVCDVPSRDEWEQAARELGESDCAIIASYSGNEWHCNPVGLTTVLKAAKVPVVAITNSGDNWLREHCDCVLSFKPREHYYSKISGYYSEHCVQFILDALYSAVFAADYDRNEVIKLRTIISYELATQQRLEDVLPY